MVGKVPELAEMFEGRLPSLLADRNHAVVMGGVALAHQMCMADPELIPRFRKALVPSLIRQLQQIISGGFSAEYDVGGVNDPFVQVRILRLLRTLGEDDLETSEAISDILTQIATSTDPSKNVGHAVLYETAVTIMNIPSEHSLRTMAINILGRLLSAHTGDSNLRYVALALLNKIIAAGDEGLAAVQRHRVTILECLHEHDPSIRRRAVDLAIGLISKDTIRAIAAELLDVLRSLSGTEELDFKQGLVTRLAVASAQFAPSAKWYVDTMKVILSEIDDAASLGVSASLVSPEVVAGSKEEIVSTFLRIINNTAELHRYAAEELWKAAVLKETILAHDDSAEVPSQYHVTEALIQATAWAIGEFADILVSARLADPGQLVDVLAAWASPESGYSAAVIGYIITSLGKLTDRLPPTTSKGGVARVESVLLRISMDYVNDSGLHYRAREMHAIVGNPALRSILLARIPPDTAGDQLGRVTSASRLSASHRGGPPSRGSTVGRERAAAGIASASPTYEGGGLMVTAEARSQSPSADSVSNVKPVVDVFAELAMLSLDGVASPTGERTGSSSLGRSPLRAMTDDEGRRVAVFEKYGVKVYSVIQEALEEKTVLHLQVLNDSQEPLQQVQIQAAVPKPIKVSLDPASSEQAQPGESVVQTVTMRMVDAQGMPMQIPRERLKLRVRLSFQLASASADPLVEVFDIARFE